MATITKKDLVLAISDKTRVNAIVVQDVVQSFFEEMNAQLGHGNRIELRDFGVFSFKKRAARIGHNPRTLEKVQVDEKVVISFKMGKKMKEMVNQILAEETKTAGAKPATAVVQPAAADFSAPKESAPATQAPAPAPAASPVAGQAGGSGSPGQ